MSVTVGIDLGGTGVRVIALTPDGAVAGDETVPTPSADVPSGWAVRDLLGQIRTVVGSAELVGVGIGASGPVDRQGVIRNDDTLPAFSHLDLTGLITAELGVRCVIDNDAVTAAIGENLYGAGVGSTALLVVTLGTGIGVAMLDDGRPFRAADGSHPEAGHLPVPGPPAPCYCGLACCWEQLASRTALDTLTGDRTQDWAGSGEPATSATFQTYGERVGVGLGSLLTIFRPDRVVLGGGAARFLPRFELGLRTALTRNRGHDWAPPIVAAQLGALSGAIGAAVLAR